MARIVIVVVGGVVQEIYTNTDTVAVVIIDHDTDGCALHEMRKFQGEECIEPVPWKPMFDPKAVTEAWNLTE